MTMVISQKSEIEVFNEDQKQLIKETFFKGKGTNEDFKLFMHVCITRKLDPFMRQIFPVFRETSFKLPSGSWGKKDVMTLQTGIDGYRVLADRTGTYAPGRSPTFTFDKDKNIESATAYVKKRTSDGTWHEVEATAFYSEYVQTFKDKDGRNAPTKFWLQMPRNQLAKCAEALAIRKACPADLSGIYTNEEMQQADVVEIHPEALTAVTENSVLPPVVLEKITSEQADSLDMLIENLTADQKQKMQEWLKKMGFSNSSDITAESYLPLFNRVKLILENNEKERLISVNDTEIPF